MKIEQKVNIFKPVVIRIETQAEFDKLYNEVGNFVESSPMLGNLYSKMTTIRRI